MDDLPWSTKAIDYVNAWENEKESESFIYEDNGDNYKYPERVVENQVIPVRLYCDARGCNKYIKGWEGYNGSFRAETGETIDLRNQCFVCKEHKDG